MANAGETTGLVETERNIFVLHELLEAKARLGCIEVAKMLQEYARAHHPWQSRTGETERTTIGAEVDQLSGDMVYAILSAGMPYDVYLETYYEGHWAWLHQAMVDKQAEIMVIIGEFLKAGLRELQVTT